MTETANVVPPKSKDDRHPDETQETIRTIIYALLIALFIRTFLFEPFNIPSASMEPTLHVGDFLFVSKYSYGYSSVGSLYGLESFTGRIGGSAPERGDIIVFKLPRDHTTDYIKRLIGLPGDTVQMRHGILYINGKAVDRDRLEHPVTDSGEEAPPQATDYIEHLPGGVNHIIRKMGDDQPLDDTEVFVVPPHKYFFMGDNRDNSSDSRAPGSGVGFVPEENLVGKARFLFFSLQADTSFLEFWKWPWAIRWSRLFSQVH